MILEFSILSAAIILSALSISMAIRNVKLFTIASTEIKRDNLPGNETVAKDRKSEEIDHKKSESKYKEGISINDANLPIGLLRAPPKPQGGFGVKQD